MDVITLSDCQEWNQIVDEACKSDFYHTHAYHLLSEKRGEGIAHLWVYRESGYMIALPLLLRPLEDVEGIGALGKGWWDATSVYGYAGPIASHTEIPEHVMENFRRGLVQSLHERHVISLFSRLHPLMPNQQMISGLGEQIRCGRTVSIDLTLSLESQWQKYRVSDRRRIRRLRRDGYTLFRDDEGRFLPEFVALYTQTMERVGAEERYFFDQPYFEQLLDLLKPDVTLLLILDGDSPICGGVFIERCGILEYHLGGTRNDYLPLAPAKLLMDEVRLWAAANRYETFHLGGGVGGSDDGLFHFKQGFSDRTHPFTLWQWVLNPGMYAAVCRHKAASDACRGLFATSKSFFPQYRCSVAPERVLLGNVAHVI